MRDVTHEALGRGRTRIVTDLERQVQKGRLAAEAKMVSWRSFPQPPRSKISGIVILS